MTTLRAILTAFAAVTLLAPSGAANPVDDARTIASAAAEEAQATIDHYGARGSAAYNQTSEDAQREVQCLDPLANHANETARPDDARAEAGEIAIAAIHAAGNASRGNVTSPTIPSPNPGPIPSPWDIVHYLLVEAPHDALSLFAALEGQAVNESGFISNETQKAVLCALSHAGHRLDLLALSDLPSLLYDVETTAKAPHVASQAYGDTVAPAYRQAREIDPFEPIPDDPLNTACVTLAQELGRDPNEYCTQ